MYSAQKCFPAAGKKAGVVYSQEIANCGLSNSGECEVETAVSIGFVCKCYVAVVSASSKPCGLDVMKLIPTM